ncbi:acyl-CoA dehydrogenase family protein [Amorphus orientalis]|uniref:Acyl-CoA dehydrogenase n=1 Tax=Amorphus orientalis TaxID=649198 RepID=A0AAE4AUD1_9HYPH|nr:acyl-CoA dehydrogenase family protein [Amorphus orientalis]MDQ0317007.1 putative acyl-CoA dehydrogenase [Amorphus orientalis]
MSTSEYSGEAEADWLGPFETHRVTNQVPPSDGRNLFDGDPVLVALLEEVLEPETEDELYRAGAYWGSGDARDVARLANTDLPVLRTHDRFGRRLDMVEYHPAYHALMNRSVAAGLHASIWDGPSDADRQQHRLRAARLYLTAQTEPGHTGPLSNTNAALAALATTPALFEEWLPAVVSRRYDHRFQPIEQKVGATLGTGFAEKQAGTDIRACRTVAEWSDMDGAHRLIGHKWFLSAPMSDAFLVLAQAEQGLSCFLMPRFCPDGSLNTIQFHRLKNKLGNSSNATAEAEFYGATGFLVGEEGRGIRTVLEMVTLTRLDGAVTSAGLMRAALVEAVHHARHRTVGEETLIEAPLMQRVLADMALDSAAATALALRLAEAFDKAADDEEEQVFARLVAPAAKYWICKSAPGLIAEAMECVGGNAYVEEHVLPRLYREAPAAMLAEGPGNVLARDLRRLGVRMPDVVGTLLESFRAELGDLVEEDVVALRSALTDEDTDEGLVRPLIERLALLAAASALRRNAPRVVADAFVSARLNASWRASYGMLDGRYNATALIDFIVPDA